MPEQEQIPQCANCRYARPAHESGGGKAGSQVAWAECRRHAPTVAWNMAAGGSVSCFPGVTGDQWCGDYKALPSDRIPMSI